jgi:imidazolonepropionase
MPLLTDIGLLLTCAPRGAQGDLHPIRKAAMAWEAGTIRWVGPEGEIPGEYRGWESESAGGLMVIPGLVDCHTHLAFAGWRAGEFEQRILGRTYLEIAAAGGGILSTVAQTRAASTADLAGRARGHLRAMGRLGVTTVEAKSGYGLSLEDELRLLEVYHDLGDGPQRLVPTLLAAHTVPPEYHGRSDAYVDLVCDRIIPEVARREGLLGCAGQAGAGDGTAARAPAQAAR